MSSEYIKIKLENFQAWKHKEITLVKGVNLLFGESGAGKSTFCRAIHFLLYGGRKHKNIGNKKETSKKAKTIVTLKFKTEEERFTIIRERPTETLTVLDKNEDSTYTDKEAQAWINARFGTEESWISSSYLGQEKDNFFMTETNAKKKDLLKQITFGDEESSVDPNKLASISDECIIELKEKMRKITNKIEIRQLAIESVKEEFPKIEEYEKITDDDINELKDKILKTKEMLIQVSIDILENNKRLKAKTKIESLIEDLKTSQNTNELENLISKVEEKLFLEDKLKGFNIKVLDYTEEELYKNKELYKYLFSKGMRQSQSVKDFLQQNKNQEQLYKQYIFELNELEKLKNLNKEIEKENKNLFNNYNLQLEIYNSNLKRIEEKEKMEFDLRFFDKRVFEIEENEIQRNRELYSSYVSNGFDPETDIKDFISINNLQKAKYEDYKEKIKICQDLELKNEQIKRENELLKINYETFLKLYNNKLSSFNEYQRKLQRKKYLIKKIDLIEETKFENDDTLDYNFLKTRISNYESAINELNCPHCNKGVLLINSKLVKGCTQSEEDKIIILNKLKDSVEELEKRKRKKELMFEFETIKDFEEIQEPEIPELPIYKELVNIEYPNKVEKYKQLPTEIPTILYKDLITLVKSIKKIDIYKKYISVKDEIELLKENIRVPEIPKKKSFHETKEINNVEQSKIIDCDIPTIEYNELMLLLESINKKALYEKLQSMKDIKTNINILKLKNKVEEIKNKEKLLESLITSYPDYQLISDNSLDEKEESLKKKLKTLEKREKLVEKLKTFECMKEDINSFREKRNKYIKEIEDLEYFREEMLAISRQSIDDLVFSVNSIVQEICSELFEKQISIRLQTTKELKSGEERSNINLSLTYDDMKYESYGELSGGEKKRVSLALLLAFMNNNPSPICILDEVLPSMDLELKKKSLAIITERCKDKFVINICHGVPSNCHENIITF